jgi:hypothetical protein
MICKMNASILIFPQLQNQTLETMIPVPIVIGMNVNAQIVENIGMRINKDSVDMNLEVIAPCPYCGSDSIACHPNDIARDGHSMAGASSADLHYTHCNGCGAEGPGANSYYEAIELHNRRV